MAFSKIFRRLVLVLSVAFAPAMSSPALAAGSSVLLAANPAATWVCRFCNNRLGADLGPEIQGGYLCASCAATAVRSNADAAASSKMLRRELESWGMHIRGPVTIQVVSADALAKVRGGRGAAGHTRWIPIVVGDKVVPARADVFILAGLPREVFEETLAHELIHAWSIHEGRFYHTHPLEEGSAEMGTYYMIQKHDSDGAQERLAQMMKSEDPDYGAGFRRALAYTKDHEFSGLLTLLRTANDFPAGY